ncbi:MAG: NADH-quinone oxidoreductase subunit A [Candidatus Carbobacillus altaicus]|uniref:NADH-quinone oxidoreductase subunit A n=1 Tax=Candidatus Carbonibacillus altaicus TaxID=2163959 RepID=A0A2R6Y412_9BACL|nr:NADH-quinone oxidoreductase subunit A [Candidatus Carbobacillus altaicus]PTQ57398.1 MAG: NADH ubiquinone oxidoreductase chain A [Candidatus Carbobacillus altaicus]
MPSLYVNNYLIVLIFILLAIGLPIVAFTLNRLLAPYHPYKEKGETYESGTDAIGTGWVRFRVQYYMFALLFVIFDVETIFLVPVAVAFDALPLFAAFELFIFVLILAVGLIYAWRKKVLEWE